MKVLVVGNGGREHALASRLSQSKQVDHVFVAPGNGGTASGLDKVSNIPISQDDFPALVHFAIDNGINLAVPGPEAPLVAGIEGCFRRVGIPCFGPSKEAAVMEGSKTFSKDFMARHNIPTAEYRNFTTYDEATKYIDSISHNVVIKASGLAAGKGVIIPSTKEEAHAALKEIMADKVFGHAGDEVVIEEFLEGDELSILAFSDGYTVVALPPAQDHKRIFDGDQGPNTGGMGCYAPTRIASKGILEEVQRTILKPTIDGLRREGTPFVGMLFTGLMMTPKGPKVLEYNVRFGDPETQTVLPLLSADTDLAEIMLACARGCLDSVSIKIDKKFSATVVVAAGGYPGSYPKGQKITLDPVGADTTIFHAGTVIRDATLQTSGGRVIAANATAGSLEEAVERAYVGVKSIHFNDMFYRRDIAHRAFKRPPQSKKESLTYAQAGVSIDAGNTLVERIKSAVKSTRRPGADAEIGGFGGTFELAKAGYHPDAPILIGAIDGVGTKLQIAHALGKHDTVGIDLVAMSVNDLVVQGAETLFFLDCYSTSHLDVDAAASFVEGVAKGCIEAGCVLLGGETAEMPGMYQGSEYDAVGTATGAVSRDNLLPKMSEMKEGDVLLGLKSSGFHSNGFSLIRRIVEDAGLEYTDPAPWDSTKSVGESLLTPTKIYVRSCYTAAQKGLVKGMAHITGGGLTENIPRMLPEKLAAEVDVHGWELEEVFRWFRKEGGVRGEEFVRVWNVGVGMVLVVDGGNASEAKRVLEENGEVVFEVGRLVKREGVERCRLVGLERWDE
ncbi:phosphoribosylformylglycinamidine cyclo-ligase [Terfezia boudieri ATCC MYA-4762]|uniref:Phosphoribosylformylglycinamidine cyclo-ligase n=1 Tax=Terfezia boudieri ATCC MYA-4762 TaxID=1051890 RepID=A0A3N4LS56_9PEZI|nr:phosphoribosylformylglycinamidine cyclo-ligase [Terfezia boudieri ATCC MYA-4762]